MNIWFVVSTPLKNISQLGWLFPIYREVKNVPNHQPGYEYEYDMVAPVWKKWKTLVQLRMEISEITSVLDIA